jgi:hypothetical protein
MFKITFLRLVKAFVGLGDGAHPNQDDPQGQ